MFPVDVIVSENRLSNETLSSPCSPPARSRLLRVAELPERLGGTWGPSSHSRLASYVATQPSFISQHVCCPEILYCVASQQQHLCNWQPPGGLRLFNYYGKTLGYLILDVSKSAETLPEPHGQSLERLWRGSRERGGFPPSAKTAVLVLNKICMPTSKACSSSFARARRITCQGARDADPITRLFYY